MRELLQAAAASSGVELSEQTEARLWQAACTLAQLTPGTGLSGYREPEEALLRAISPAFAYLRWEEAPREGLLADLGAGAGALGAGIAILCPGLEVHLVDRAQRAFTVCELLAARLELGNLHAVWLAAGEGAGERLRYDAVVFRALARGPKALQLALSITSERAFIGAYHRAADPWYNAAQDTGVGIRRLGTVPTPVEGLAMTGYLVASAYSPQ